jgi:chemotaxis protein MotB
MQRMLALTLLAAGCAGPAQEAPPAKTLRPEVEALNKVDTDVARVKEISQLDRGNEEKKIVISTLEAKVAELQAKLDAALQGTKAAPAPKAEFSTVEKASGNRVRVRLSGELVYTPGSARITREGRQVLSEVAKVLKESPSKKIEVAGHSDKQPSGTKYEDNWQLSAERARRVVAYLFQQGVTGKQMIASGYSDTDPVDPAESEDAYRKNRRVEIFIEPNE